MPHTPEMLQFLRELHELKEQNKRLMDHNVKVLAALDLIAEEFIKFNRTVRAGTVAGTTIDGLEKITGGIRGIAQALRGDDEDDGLRRRRNR